MTITIIKDGPYLVTGSIPIREMYIVPKGNHMVLEEGRKLPQAEEYALWRCGESKNKPFCDGSHQVTVFNGSESASKAKYADRVQGVTQGTKCYY